MASKVFIEPLEQQEPNGPNIRLLVQQGANQYKGEATLNPTYLDKVNHWLHKNKYSITPVNND